MRRLITILVASCLAWVAYLQTDGFSPLIIQGELFSQAIEPISQEAEKALRQPFHYLGKGRQSFVFESQDSKYVVKFFNQKYLEMPWYAFIRGEKEKTKRQRRRYFYEHSYEIAFREFGEEIVYLHLSQGEVFPVLSIVDRGGRRFKIDLTQTPFVLQRKGVPIYDALETVYQKEGIEGLCREIDQFCYAISERIEKGIGDADIDVQHNWGYLNGRIFHLDPGRLYWDQGLSERSRRMKEWSDATKQFSRWLQEHYPEAADHLRERVAELDCRRLEILN